MDNFKSKFDTCYSAPGEISKNIIYQKLKELVIKQNVKFEDEVKRAKDKYNLKVRSLISDRSGLSFASRSKEKNNEQERQAIPIVISDKVPKSLLAVLEDYDAEMIELLLHYHQIVAAKEEITFQSKNNHFEDKRGVYFPRAAAYFEVIKDLDFLINEVDNSGVQDRLKTLGPDVLGAYYYLENRIELYWIGIALLARVLNETVENCTLIVLIHELAHAYMHNGFDKDGSTWDTRQFEKCDIKIVEGFAQIYTQRLCKDYFHFSLNTFNALLPKQASEYNEFDNWFKTDEKDLYEKIRSLLLFTRRKEDIIYSAFEEEIENIKNYFNRRVNK